MAIEFEISTQINAPPETLYRAWLDSGEHSAMTGGRARVSDREKEDFQAWDGYIRGRNLALEPGRRILQSWRTTEFAQDEADSTLEIRFEAEGDGTRITLRHTGLPPHGRQYEQGWVESYFEPMREYFENQD